MGVPHLEAMREYFKKNPKRLFSKTDLRNALLQNYNTILQNLEYLIITEKVVKEVKTEGKTTTYGWIQ